MVANVAPLSHRGESWFGLRAARTRLILILIFSVSVPFRSVVAAGRWSLVVVLVYRGVRSFVRSFGSFGSFGSFRLRFEFVHSRLNTLTSWTSILRFVRFLFGFLFFFFRFSSAVCRLLGSPLSLLQSYPVCISFLSTADGIFAQILQ